MEVPDSFNDPKRPDLVFKLRKSLYGLKHAPSQWYAKINKFLVDDLGVRSSSNELCMYTRRTSYRIMLIVLYVNNMLIATNNPTTIAQIKEEFRKILEMKDLAETSVCLGLEIHRNRANRMLHVSQNSYTENVLKRFGV